MKQIIAPLTGLLTLLLGLGVAELAGLYAPLPEVGEPDFTVIEINPCALNSNSETNLNRDIVVQTTLYRIDDHILVYPNIFADVPILDCGSQDPARAYDPSTFDPSVWTELDMKEYAGPNAELPALFRTNRAKWEIDAEIRGVLLKQIPREYGPIYRLVPTQIRLVGPWRRITLKGAA